MDEVRCPKCRGGLRTCHRALGYEAVCAEDCGFVGPILPEPRMALEACRHLCWQEVRHRLPTYEEDVALRERHGEGAGFFVRSTDGISPATYRRPVWLSVGDDLLPSLRRLVNEGVYRLTCWPTLPDGRPVAWPEV